MTAVPDEIFANPRLADIYDDIDADRSDLDHFVAIVEEFGARSVLDIGCGTGALACRLAALEIDGVGLEVVGVDPAAASLDVARRKSGADRVRWILGEATSAPTRAVDMAVMTGNVAQVFLDDTSWLATLHTARKALTADGHLVFETRNPAARGWEEWTPERSLTVTTTMLGQVESWVELTAVNLPFVSFRRTYRFLDDGDVLTSDSTLRFRGPDELAESLNLAGFAVDEVRDAPDRPGREIVVIASPAGWSDES